MNRLNNIRKATGYDNISPKIIKLAQPVLSNPIYILLINQLKAQFFLIILKLLRFPRFLKITRLNSWSSSFQCLHKWHILFCTKSTIYNYADDNTVSYSDPNLDKVVESLETDSLNLIN